MSRRQTKLLIICFSLGVAIGAALPSCWELLQGWQNGTTQYSTLVLQMGRPADALIPSPSESNSCMAIWIDKNFKSAEYYVINDLGRLSVKKGNLPLVPLRWLQMPVLSVHRPSAYNIPANVYINPLLLDANGLDATTHLEENIPIEGLDLTVDP